MKVNRTWQSRAHMRIPTDLEVLNTIYGLYQSEFVAFNKGKGSRSSKIYVPIDCTRIANALKVDPDIIFGRLYYHLEKQYGYKQSSGSNVHFFALKVGEDLKCINFPLLTSVLAGLRQEKSRFRIGTATAILALFISAISLTLSIIQLEFAHKSTQPSIETETQINGAGEN